MLRMTVEGVGFDHHRQTVVVLKDWEGRKLLLIWIGPNEARSIALELEGAQPSRPLSHDLVLSCLQAAGGRVARVVINDLQEGTFYATIDIDTPRGIMHIDSRPSDAIAVAVRAKCPVFVDGGALDALIEMNDIISESGASGDEIEEEPGSNQILPLEAGEGSLRSLPPAADPQMEEEIARFKRLIGELDMSE
ncbi:MAG: bifunctional nuclease family protein [Abitibacteriaceae bacterium]|nr:bifunctional nuclease family protein [Abditibacteriaceae bacterium]